MFSGFTSFLSWSGTKLSATGLVDTDLERGAGNRHGTDDNRSSKVDQVVGSSTLPTSGCDIGSPSEESATTSIPRFITTRGRSASIPPEFLRVNPPDPAFEHLKDNDRFCSAKSSPSSASSNHSYTRLFHRTRIPKRTLSTRSLGPGGIHSSLTVLSPIYEPQNPDLKDVSAAQNEANVGELSTFPGKNHASSIHSTTSTIQERMMNLQVAHPAFLKRSLNRSLSETSSNSLHSEVSGAPQLPPLHFRPAFTGIPMKILTSPSNLSSGPSSATSNTPRPPRVVVPTRPPPSTSASPLRSQLSHSQPNTPQSLSTPRNHRFGALDHPQKCSAIYEDSGSEKSFVTATSGEADPGSRIIMKHGIPSTADSVIYPGDQERARKQSEYAKESNYQGQSSGWSLIISPPELPQIEQEGRQHQINAFSESETTFNINSDSQHGHNSIPVTVQKSHRPGAASVISIGSTTVRNESVIVGDRIVEETATVGEEDNFIMERWTKSLFFSAPGGKELLLTTEGDQKEHLVSSTRVLFWAGFIAPWCWLVGGWMPYGGASVCENETRYETLKEKISTSMRSEAVSREDGAGLKKWVLPDPSSSFKATARAPSTSNDATLYPRENENGRLATADPWVRRCRIASMVGGTVLGLALIVMVIVLGVAAH